MKRKYTEYKRVINLEDLKIKIQKIIDEIEEMINEDKSKKI